MHRPLQRHAGVIVSICAMLCTVCLFPYANPAQASELFGDAPGQPAQGEVQNERSEGIAREVVDSMSLLGLGLGLTLIPLAQPIAQAVSTAAGAGGHDQDHGQGHGQGHGQ